MNEDTTKIIAGPPGTGKTTYLLDVVDNLLQEGIEPHGILYLAFTRRAAHEAITRAMRKFKLTAEDFPWFRTIHSLAFTQLGVRPSSIMSGADYGRIARKCGWRLTSQWSTEGTVNYIGSSPDDKALAMEIASRTMGVSLRELWEKEPDPDIRWGILEGMQKELNRYKSEEQKLDFVDLLQEFLIRGEVPPHRALIVDEAQDLSALQWKVVRKLGEKSRMAFVAGDDDQAIFQWAGANPKELVDLPGERIVLPKSYRVPSVIKSVAMNILTRIRGPRIEKRWEPVNEGGIIKRVTSLEQAPLESGRWLILCRNLYTVEQVATYCYSRSLFYESQGNSTASMVSREMVQAANSWMALGRKETIKVRDAVNMYVHMSPRTGYIKGFKSMLEREDPDDLIDYQELSHSFGLLRQPASQWWHILDRIPKEAIEKMKVIKKDSGRHDQPIPEPQIRISTIHSAKGAEEDQVLLCTDMTRRTYEAFLLNPDPEHRVWYVAVTRAKQALYILEPQTLNSYEL